MKFLIRTLIGRRFLFLLGTGIVALFIGGLYLLSADQGPKETSRQLVARAKLALSRANYEEALRFTSKVTQADSEWPRAQLIAGEAATRCGRYKAAMAHYAVVPRDGSRTAVLAAFAQGELARETGDLTLAEREYRYVLGHDSSNVTVHERLAYLLGAVGRRWESMPHYLALIRESEWTLQSLAFLGDLERPLEAGSFLRAAAKNHPEDPLVKLGLATENLMNGDVDQAQRQARQVVKQRPTMLAAQALLGELLVDADGVDFGAWLSQLPETADDHPDIWYVRGLRARRIGELKTAARCFWEALRLAPEHRRASYQLGQVLVALGETVGDDFSLRAEHLYQVSLLLDRILLSEGRDESAVSSVAQLMESMGRAWEAFAWARTAFELFPEREWPREMIARVQVTLNPDSPRTLDRFNLALKHDLSHLPFSHEVFRTAPPSRPQSGEPDLASTVRFELEDEARIDFVYENAADPSTVGARQFEQTGGGVAVIDFDMDGWPDLHFTQGAAWPTGASRPSTSAALVDQLFRNIQGQGFTDVTAAAMTADAEYSQGCSSGDYDCDGFADLYIANIGSNCLYRNNGDGTLSVVNLQASQEGKWTTSCAVVDLNADGYPDLFDVNYLTGNDIYTAICDGFACSPKNFEGVPDEVHISRGDGTFDTLETLTPQHLSKGLGVVAFDVFDRGRPCLFIANDQVPNFFLRNRHIASYPGVEFSEEGFVSGLAFNVDGLPMACMGVAAGDADGDGRTDLFVTNFADEYNTLYLQDADGLFRDATSTSGLRAPSFPYVGWGTQFLDAECDGDSDLVVTNGHVDDYRRKGGMYHMPPQFFNNVGDGRFEELTPEKAGSYFGKNYLGRGLARLDWNGDGRMDFVVSNIGEQASLVTNRSKQTGHFLNLRLHAKKTARDAVGTVVSVDTDGKTWRKQLIAGDGYMASNQRLLQFGLGRKQSLREVKIQWPSGHVDTLHDLPVNVTLDIVEGQTVRTLAQSHANSASY